MCAVCENDYFGLQHSSENCSMSLKLIGLLLSEAKRAIEETYKPYLQFNGFD